MASRPAAGAWPCYAAGDMAHRAALPMPFAAVSWASASGTLAGAMLDQDLLTTDFDLPPLPWQLQGE
jgi:hypothetical protein